MLKKIYEIVCLSQKNMQFQKNSNSKNTFYVLPHLALHAVDYYLST